MTPQDRSREWWIDKDVRNTRLTTVVDFECENKVHVIEFAAYAALLAENEKLRSQVGESRIYCQNIISLAKELAGALDRYVIKIDHTPCGCNSCRGLKALKKAREMGVGE
jgi:hypothetical protein